MYLVKVLFCCQPRLYLKPDDLQIQSDLKFRSTHSGYTRFYTFGLIYQLNKFELKFQSPHPPLNNLACGNSRCLKQNNKKVEFSKFYGFICSPLIRLNKIVASGIRRRKEEFGKWDLYQFERRSSCLRYVRVTWKNHQMSIKVVLKRCIILTPLQKLPINVGDLG